MEKTEFQRYDRLSALVHWLVLLLVLFYIQIAEVPENEAVLYLFILGAAIFVLVFHHLMPKKYSGPQKYLLESLLDIGAITFLMINSGGHTSVFFFLYFLVIAGLALTLGAGVTFLATVLTTVAFLAIVFLELTGGATGADVSEHVTHTLILIVPLWVVGFLAASLSRINRALHKKEALARQELATIEQTSATLVSSLNIAQILERIATGLTAGIGYDRTLIFLINKEKRTIEGRYGSGIAAENVGKVRIALPGVEGVLLDTLWEAKPRLIWNLGERDALRDGFRSAGLRFSDEAALVPIVSRADEKVCENPENCDDRECPLSAGASGKTDSTGSGNKRSIEKIINCPYYKVFGVILVDNSKSKKVITEDNLVSLQIFAQNAAIAIENAILYAKLQREAKQVSLISKVGKVVTSSLKIEEIYSTLVTQVKKIIPFDRVSISLLDETGENVESYAFAASGRMIEKKKVKPKEICCAEWVTRHKKPLLRPDLAQEPQFKDDTAAVAAGINTCYSLPLLVKDRAIGTFCVYSKEKAAYTQEDLQVLMPIGEQLAIAIENAMLYEKTERLAITDSLTGLYNHGYARSFMAREFARASRYGKSLSVVMMDVDDFKNYNDSFGHPEGDKVLVRIAEILKGNVRDIDIAARYGGDEFLLVLPETGPRGAKTVAERVQNQVKEVEFMTRNSKVTHLTITAGVASYPAAAKTVEELVQKADDFLYGTKKIKRKKTTLSYKSSSFEA